MFSLFIFPFFTGAPAPFPVWCDSFARRRCQPGSTAGPLPAHPGRPLPVDSPGQEDSYKKQLRPGASCGSEKGLAYRQRIEGYFDRIGVGRATRGSSPPREEESYNASFHARQKR